MSSLAAVASRPRTRSALWFVPVLLLLAAALVANLGLTPEPKAYAASTDTVTVTASVASSLSVADACANTIAITVVPGGHADDDCAIDFGSTNDSSVTLRAAANASPFIASFANNADACAALGAVDESGLKFISAGTNVAKATAWSCAATALGTNAGYNGLTTTPANVCTTSALGTTLRCTLGVGVWEQGSDLAPGSYAGQLNLDVIA